MKLKLLQIFLISAAIGWGISIYGVFSSWEQAANQLKGLGAKEITYDPMLDYWLRMTAGAFTGIGIFFLSVAIKPKKFSSSIPLIGILLFIEGIVLVVHGFRLHLDPIPFYVDSAFCLINGLGIWLLRNAVKSSSS